MTYSYERNLEADALAEAARLGWASRKMTSNKGDPDRMFFKDGRVVFVELKRERGGRVSAIQKMTHSMFSAHGCPVVVATSVAQVVTALEFAQ